MDVFIMILIAVVCVLLIGVILVQNSKGGGLATGFSSANQIGGVKKTADFLEKATWTLVIALMVLSAIAPNFGSKSNVVEESQDTFQEQIQATPTQQPQMPSNTAPALDLEDQPSDNGAE